MNRIQSLPGQSTARGFSLITALIWILVLGSLCLLVHLRLTDHLRTNPELERQLYSLILAQNGIEFARSILPTQQLTSLLRGPDGAHQGSEIPQWRNPLTFDLARRSRPGEIRLTPDDGLPVEGGRLFPTDGFGGVGEGRYFVRFSNNPEEPPHTDTDKVVLVRSMGIASGTLPRAELPLLRNGVSLVEARLRQETTFDPPAALVLFGDEGIFQIHGEAFRLDGGARPAVATVTAFRSGIEEHFRESLQPGQESRVRGAGGRPSILDVSDQFRTDSDRKRIHEAAFWSHFLENLPRFAIPGAGIRWLPTGDLFQGTFEGILVARGNLFLQGNARITGIVIHLGGGWLHLSENAQVSGGVWMAHPSVDGRSVYWGPLQLSVADLATIRFDNAAVRSALQRLPPSQLEWRILFPEMVQ